MRSQYFNWFAAWLVLVVAALIFRPLLAVDETRYFSVAWEMWQSGGLLVPHLNGATYSHKPPLLFWLINGLWGLLGVSETLARTVSPLFGLGSLFLTARLGRWLWPERNVEKFAPWIVLGSLVFVVAGTLSMFDVLLTFWVLVAISGAVLAAGPLESTSRNSVRRQLLGWIIFGVGIGLGVLTKGPVVLVFTVPVALLGPVWIGGGMGRAGYVVWYAGVVAGIAVGAAIALSWALPAASAGGTAYGNEILWGQTGSRIVSSVAHARPFWWYGPMFFVLVFPWALSSKLWRQLRIDVVKEDRGVRLCLVWVVGALILLSLVSGKQPHYVLPLIPGVALLVAAGARVDEKASRFGLLPWIVFAGFGLVLFAIFFAKAKIISEFKIASIPDGLGLAVMELGALSVAIGVSGMWRHGRTPNLDIPNLALATIVLGIGLNVFAGQNIFRLYDVSPTAMVLATIEEQGRPIGHVGKYHGQFQFLGRLTNPLEVLAATDIESWANANPNGVLVGYHRSLPATVGDTLDRQVFRSRTLVIWEVDSAKNTLDYFFR